MRRWAVCVLGAAVLMPAAPSTAQQASEPLPRVAVDFHGITAGLPSAAGWTPPVPADTTVPTRSLGLQGGGTVYIGRFGLGASMSFASGRTTPVVAGTPVVSTRVQTFAPQASFNFGRGRGWSYLSLGFGAAKVDSEAEAVGALPAASAESGWVPALNFGGGARWFMRDHLGFGFDLRWHRLSSRDVGGGLTAPSTRSFVLGAGITLQ